MERHALDLNAPAALAFSGGGDSTAMLHALRDNPWVKHVFIIDHALRDGSAEEVSVAAKYARSFGYKVQTDRWAHKGISSAIQAQAREYRYTALGRMCREAGIEHLITAHTADDQAETLLMRLDRQTGWRGLAGMPDRTYAPIWPALASVTLHRPWLGVSRQDIRAYNKAHKLCFVDDPSNENRNFARVRARQALAADAAMREDLLSQQKEMRHRLTEERSVHREWLEQHAVVHPQGFIETDAVPPPELLLHILNAAGGQGGPIDAAKRDRLRREMLVPEFKAATLGGAWILAKKKINGHSFVFLRDRVAVLGRSNAVPAQLIDLAPDVKTPWDGRFICQAKQPKVHVEFARGNLQKLRQLTEFNGLFDLSPDVRESLPIFFFDGRPIAFGACDTKFVTARACSASRLQALFT